jgi:alkylation response protein AidB-like acyl-CoA dehydrogenase
MILEHPLSNEECSFLDLVAEFARNEVMPHADQWDHDENLPREIFTKAGKIGLMGMVAPKEYGGRGMSYVAAALVIKELGKAYVALSMDIAAHNALERYLRDAKLCTIGERTSEVQRLVIARHVLKEAKPLKLAHREPRNPNA